MFSPKENTIKESGLSENAVKILEQRYLLRDGAGKLTETPDGMFRRVAREVAYAEKAYGKKGKPSGELEESFYEAMSRLEFLPNSPTLMNAGTELGQLSACFVLPVEDSIEGIFSAIKHMAVINQSGGGTGFSFSRLRPRGSTVRTTGGIASGPVSFMQVFNTATETIRQGGRRRGANMGILRVDHPDIKDFIEAKSEEGSFENFNLSVGATDVFMRALLQNGEYAIKDPLTGRTVAKENAAEIFGLIVKNAWEKGDPGIVFLDRINRENPTPAVGEIESTNPCGEQPLLPYESCNLGSINLSRMLHGQAIDWEKLGELVRTAIRFLDNVIDINRYPLAEIEKVTRANRKIGLGVMGFAELLIQLGIAYGSKDGLRTGAAIMEFILKEARKESAILAAAKGAFPSYQGSLWEKRGLPPMRNATLTTIAPTGTISLIAGTTSGIEPLFGLSYNRRVLEGTLLFEANSLLGEDLAKAGLDDPEIMFRIAQNNSLEGIEGIPKKMKSVYRTAYEIAPEWHVRMQAAFQKFTDNAVSKTVNLPGRATPADVGEVFMQAYKLKCKGITVYRYGSRKDQPVRLTGIEGMAEPEEACSPRACPY